VTKHELVQTVQKDYPALTQKQIEGVVDATFQNITQSVKRDQAFRWPGFGTFKLRRRAPREGRNPQTGQTIRIGETVSMTLSPAQQVKQTLGAKTTARARPKAKAAGR
jgi:nucleoid DNA-binding protein